MVELKIITDTTTTTVHVHAPGKDVQVEFRMCLYCGENLVPWPKQRFCQRSHSVLYCRYEMAKLIPPIKQDALLLDKTTA